MKGFRSMSDDPFNLVLKTETPDTVPSDIIVMVLYDIDRDIHWTFSDQPDANGAIAEGVDLVRKADQVICHTNFHCKAIKKFFGVDLSDTYDDTFKMARLLQPSGNGLGEWASRLGFHRTQFRGSWRWTQEAENHCIHDTKIIAALYRHLLGGDRNAGFQARHRSGAVEVIR
jgi:hypothetical protein